MNLSSGVHTSSIPALKSREPDWALQHSPQTPFAWLCCLPHHTCIHEAKLVAPWMKPTACDDSLDAASLLFSSPCRHVLSAVAFSEAKQQKTIQRRKSKTESSMYETTVLTTIMTESQLYLISSLGYLISRPAYYFTGFDRPQKSIHIILSCHHSFTCTDKNCCLP